MINGDCLICDANKEHCIRTVKMEQCYLGLEYFCCAEMCAVVVDSLDTCYDIIPSLRFMSGTP